MGSGVFGDLFISIEEITIEGAPIVGCMDMSACNYDADAEIACDDCCIYESEYWADEDGDGYGFGGTILYCPGDEPAGEPLQGGASFLISDLRSVRAGFVCGAPPPCQELWILSHTEAYLPQ